MGLLDDAIREHLDLKRRRGADPAEIERAEREALGPVRRPGDPEADVALGEHEPAAIDERDGASTPDEHLDDAQAAEETSTVHEEGDVFEEGPGVAGSMGTEIEEAAPHAGASVRAQPDLGSEYQAYDPAEPADEFDSLETGGQTIEYDVEQELHSHEASESPPSDVLEETPEFLQDTPDHDRLWFEQRPPRDFDFDG